MAKNLILLFFGFCLWIFTSVVLSKTDSQDVSALNDMYKSLNSPSKLKGWTSNGGDPCDSWDGITCKGSSITEIRLSGLRLSGSLGYQLSNMKSITYLDVSKNNLNGNLPYQLPLSLDYLDLSENDFNGNIPYSISLMNSLTYLNIAHNQLNGELSDAFQKLPNLETIDLSSNQLTGKLPESFANLTSLKTLHLQDNRFKGSINVLRDLPLDDLNVANNEFSGWIPNELKGIGKLETEGNQWLTMAAPPPPPGTQYRERDSGGSKNVGVGVVVTAACLGLLVLTAIIIALISRKKHAPSSHFMDEEKGGSHHGRTMYTPESSQMLHSDAIGSFKGLKAKDYNDSTDTKASFKRTSSVRFKNSPILHMITPEGSTIGSHTSPDQMLPSSPIECFSISDLQNATMGFSPSRFLGEGTIGRVYKAKYLHGRILAVKEIDSSLLGKGNPEEFSSLVSNISRIHHPNVAELIGYCSEKGHNLLIYEYFTSGSLHRFLHLSDDFSNPLTWNTRIRIALGTARAIEYLHEVCSPPLVHKNIKSSNILLDNELNPHLSDYGMANFHHRTSQNLGVGYNAPECTDPSAYTFKSDIYSFGVVMLELLSGRTPYDSNRAKAEQSLVHWARPRLQEMEAIDQMADPALCGLYSPASVSKFSEIVSLCVQMEPELRPQISEVVEALKKLV